ncbi:MAG: flagellar assembly protein FliW [Spirochaetia bacterium]|nr:flagellar assembly protein FliW [Spirochaetia bacterium]
MSVLATKALGKVEVAPGAIIDFPEGLIGFRDFTSFALLNDRDESPFLWLQSTRESSLAFIVVDPSVFVKGGYQPNVSQSDLDILGVPAVSSCDVYSIVTIPQTEPEKMTANLQGPILINRQKRLGRQVISMDDRHIVRARILQEMDG